MIHNGIKLYWFTSVAMSILHLIWKRETSTEILYWMLEWPICTKGDWIIFFIFPSSQTNILSLEISLQKRTKLSIFIFLTGLPQATKRQLIATILSLRQLWLLFKQKNTEKTTILKPRQLLGEFFHSHLKIFCSIHWKSD